MSLLLLGQDIPNFAFGHKHTYGKDESSIEKHFPLPHKLFEQVEPIFSIHKKKTVFFINLKSSYIPLQVLPVHVGKQLQIKLVKPSMHTPLTHGLEVQALGTTKFY